MRVLIVEDNENMRIVLRRYFEGIACDVIEADTVDAALALIAEAPMPKLITLDLRLGEAGEVRTLERIHEIKAACPDAVVLVLSGVVSAEEEARVIEAGAHGFIHKLEVTTQLTFCEKIAQILRSLAQTPERYQRNISVVEGMAAKFTDYVKAQSGA